MTQGERAQVYEEIALRLRRMAAEAETIERRRKAVTFRAAERDLLRWVADWLDAHARNARAGSPPKT